MRSRKNIFLLPAKLSLIGIVTVLFLNLTTSCTNTCAGFDCQQGECQDGACVCDEGYEGSSCNTAWSEKFIGTYEGTDCYDAGSATYSVNSGSEPDEIIYDNKYKGTIKNGDELIFPEQDAELDGVEFIFSGTGSVDGDGLKLILFSKYPNFDVKCELNLSRSN